jgi:hypothetical protein
MASSGLEAWKKHYSGKGDVSTVVKTSTTTYLPNNKRGPTLEQGTTVVVQSLTEKEYLSYVRGSGSGTKVNAHVPIKVGSKTLLCSFNDLAKPREGTGTIDLHLQTVFTVAGASQKEIDIAGYKNVQCAIFKSGSSLRSIVVANLKTNKLLDTVPAFKKSVITYFEGTDATKIKWLGAVGDSEKAQFAKYLGEVVIGLALLEKKNVITGTNPFINKTVKEFIIPMSDSFPGADSFCRMSDGTLIPISNKADAGAKASFWSNIFAPLYEHPEYLKGKTSSVVGKLYTAAKTIGIATSTAAAKSAKSVVYEYGIREVLGMKTSEIKNTYQVYEEFKKYDKVTDYSPEVRLVYNKLKGVMKSVDDQTALRNLDSSTTVFFSKMIAEGLNTDAGSFEIAKKIIGGKKYYQANMNVRALKNEGRIHFDMVQSGETSIVFIGTKSPYTNIEASQGTVNYELKRIR